MSKSHALVLAMARELHRHRTETGLCQGCFAIRSGLTEDHIRRLEEGSEAAFAELDLTMFFRMAAATEAIPEDLMRARAGDD